MLFIAVALIAAGCSSKDEEPTTEASYPESSGSESAEPMTAEAEPATADTPTDPAQTSDPVGAGLDPVSPAREPGTAKAADLTDEQIAKITETVDSGEIEQAKLAQTKAKNASVKQFAKQMATHHQKAKREGAQLAKQAAMTPQESPVYEDLKRKGDETLQTLKTAERAAFDQKYMQAQVDQHQEVLNLIDQQLMPSAESPELKSQLEKTRTMVDSHLSEAKQIHAKLADAAGSETQAAAE